MRKPRKQRSVAEFDPTNPAPFEEAAEQDQREELTEEEQEKQDFLQLMGTEGGRRFVNRFLEKTHVFHSTFSTDPLQMAFSEGERNIGLWLMAQIEADAMNEYVLLRKEQNA